MSYGYKKAAIREFASALVKQGYEVWLAGSEDYGVFTKGGHVLSFGFDFGVTVSGNYGPPSRESGTGWRISDNGDPNRAEEYFAARPSRQQCGDGWSYLCTLEQHLKQYGESSKYKRFD